MQMLARGQRSDPGRPVLSVFTPRDGVLADAGQVAYAILDRTGDVPVQVFPETGRAEALRLGTGHYLAPYEVPADASLGRYAVDWRVHTDAGEQRFETEFEVLAAPLDAPQPGYCMIQDLRDEGFGPDTASDSRLGRTIALASRYIERVTGRFFEPRRLRIELDGRGVSELLLGDPIIAIEQIEIGGAVPLASAEVYSRHLTQGLMLPDDRENPRIRLGVPAGTRNIRVTGLFGYTEADGTPAGGTPLLIREACKRLVVREIPRLSDTGPREDMRNRYRIVQEKTREQSYSLDRLHLRGTFTGDPDIDELLLPFLRPAGLGAA